MADIMENENGCCMVIEIVPVGIVMGVTAMVMTVIVVIPVVMIPVIEMPVIWCPWMPV